MKFILALILTVVTAFGEDIYIAQTAQGSGNGSSAANAAPIAWFNTAGNWNASVANDGKIGPGDTVYWIGTISSAAVFQGSGAAGNPITVEWDGAAKFSAPTWSSAGAVQLGSNSYIILDGKNTGKVGARATVDGATWNVSVECTANGQGLANATPGTTGIRGGNNGRDIIVRNIRTKNLYVRTPYSADGVESGIGMSICVTQNASIENCYIAEGVDGISIKTNSATGTGANVSDCTILRVSNGIKPATLVAGQTMKGTTILRNRIDGLDIWGNLTGAGDHHHSDGIQTVLGTPGTRALNIVIAYNHLGPNIGKDIGNGLSQTTCAIFLEDDNEAPFVYNNFVQLAQGHTTANPAISATHTAGSGTQIGLVANNTVMAVGGASTAYGTVGSSVIGNIGYQTNTWLNRPQNSTGTVNYNVYYGPPSDRDGQCYDGRIFGSFASWQSLTGFDANSANADPKLNSNGTLQVGSPAIGRAPVQTLFNDDFYGNPRGGAPWDSGAFKFGGSTTPSPTPGPTATPQPTPPPPQLSFALSWNTVPNAATYKVYENGAVIAETANTAYSLEGKTGPKNYQVTAVNASGESPKSNQVTLPAPPAPSPTPQPTPSPTATPLPIPAAPVLQINQS